MALIDDLRRICLPTLPEPFAALKARYAAALAEVHDVESIRLGNAVGPEMMRRHVFDFEDCLRLVIRREACAGSGVYLHLSASLDDECELYAAIVGKEVGTAHLPLLAMSRFKEISGYGGPMPHFQISRYGVPHWFLPETEGKGG